jgi:hypothetical protein
VSDKRPRRQGWLGRLFGKARAAVDLDQRIDRIAQGLLENESLTADLDDVAADDLLHWAIDCAKSVAQDTAGLDDAAAEEAMYPRLRATRRMIRHANRLAVQWEEMNEVTRPALLSKMLEQAAIVYGSDVVRSSTLAQQNTVLSSDQQQTIHQLRALVEGPAELSDQEEGEA